ncbi:MAG: helix-turn-helix transcriptional regulator [Chloroflexi bacterium]|nr:MAG: helix-turn-helix transcriptional regulator [Chloroflexota bacterium]
MKRYSYRKRDYAFAQMMLTLRTNIGLTQVALADRLGASRRAVAEWEAGLSYPKATNSPLRAISTGCRCGKWPPGLAGGRVAGSQPGSVGWHRVRMERTWPVAAMMAACACGRPAMVGFERGSRGIVVW